MSVFAPDKAFYIRSGEDEQFVLPSVAVGFFQSSADSLDVVFYGQPLFTLSFDDNDDITVFFDQLYKEINVGGKALIKLADTEADPPEFFSTITAVSLSGGGGG